jgi:hypothetical protein
VISALLGWSNGRLVVRKAERTAANKPVYQIMSILLHVQNRVTHENEGRVRDVAPLTLSVEVDVPGHLVVMLPYCPRSRGGC